MAGKRQRPNGTWEFVFKRKGVLPEPVYFTFDSEEEGDRYAARAEELLERGLVPIEMEGGQPRTLCAFIDMYEANVSPMARSEKQLLPAIRSHVEGVRIEVLDYPWVENWVREMHAAGRAPSTITKRVSGLARVIDWAMRRNMVSLTANPLRLLPKGYGSKGFDRNKLWDGERDRRLEQTEEGAIRSVLADKKEALLFDMALETAMRLGEMFTLKTEDVDLTRRTIFIHRSKPGHRRQVPISSTLLAKLQAHDMSQEYMFPDWWQGGDQDHKELVGHRITHLFARRFAQAECPDFRFHDLRHTAVCRLYEKTSMSDMEISKITGHKGFRMLQRYANLRGSDLAAKMW
jgi:integrase